MPRIDFRSQGALQSRALSKCIELYGRTAHDCSGILTRGCGIAGQAGNGLCPALIPALEQARVLVSIPWASGGSSCTLLCYCLSFIHLLLFFPLSLPAGFPSDPSLPSSTHSIGWAGDWVCPEGIALYLPDVLDFSLALSEQPPASSWACCNLDSQPFASLCSWFILLVFNVGFASLGEGYSHLGNIYRAELLFFFFFSPHSLREN